MPSSQRTRFARSDIFLIAEIKVAIEAFERGDTNARDTIAAVLVAVEAHRTIRGRRRKAA